MILDIGSIYAKRLVKRFGNEASYVSEAKLTAYCCATHDNDVCRGLAIAITQMPAAPGIACATDRRRGRNRRKVAPITPCVPPVDAGTAMEASASDAATQKCGCRPKRSWIYLRQ